MARVQHASGRALQVGYDSHTADEEGPERIDLHHRFLCPVALRRGRFLPPPSPPPSLLPPAPLSSTPLPRASALISYRVSSCSPLDRWCGAELVWNSMRLAVGVIVG
jgi:hypothetical protein